MAPNKQLNKQLYKQLYEAEQKRRALVRDIEEYDKQIQLLLEKKPSRMSG
jgi:hypothetical protein